MITAESNDFGYEDWHSWAEERASYVEFFDRKLPQMKFLEREGYLEFPENLDINSSADIEAVLDGEYRWEDKQENQSEAMFVVYDLGIELSRAEEEFLEQATPGEAKLYDDIQRANARKVDDSIVGQFR